MNVEFFFDVPCMSLAIRSIKPVTVTKKHAIRAMAAKNHPRKVQTRAGVIPQLESLVIQHVCPIMNCDGVYFGDEHHQMQVLDTFMSIMRTKDISHGVGYVLRALLVGDKDLAYDMATSFDMYNSSLNLIHESLARLDTLVELDGIVQDVARDV